MFFKDRHDAGQELAKIVAGGATGIWDVVGIARGGVIIANEIAKVLGVKPKAICVEDFIGKKGIFVVSSLGSGAIFTPEPEGESGIFVPDFSRINSPDVHQLVQQTAAKQMMLTQSKSSGYGPRVLLCDDGVVSGRTLLTAIQSLKHYGIGEIAVAIPVVLPWVVQESFQVFTWRVTKMTNPTTGVFYNSFEDVEDEEVIAILRDDSLVAA